MSCGAEIRPRPFRGGRYVGKAVRDAVRLTGARAALAGLSRIDRLGEPAASDTTAWNASRPDIRESDMSQTAVTSTPEKTVSVVRGQHHKFMLIPIMAHHAEFFEAGPVTFAVEGRVLGDAQGRVGERGASIHVLHADRKEEYARFDCFERIPHYHYILNAEQHNIVWGYDSDINGPMLPWALGVIRDRLPAILRRVGATGLAERAERDGWDKSVLAKVKAAMIAADARTRPGTDMIQEGRDWYARWKTMHPQFNTVDY
jgi:hypothetical protein